MRLNLIDHSLLHQLFDCRLDPRDVALRMNSFADDDAQFALAGRLCLRDGGLGPLDCFFHVKSMEIDRSRWRVRIILCEGRQRVLTESC